MRDPARTPHAAQQRYLRYLQRSLSCLTGSVWVVGPRSDQRALTIAGEPIRLVRNSGATLLFYANQRFNIVQDERFSGEWKVKTLGYIYSIYVEPPSKDEEAKELLAWHWHPISTPDRPQPHLHLEMEHAHLGVPLPRLHLPTGRVAFEDIVRLLVSDLDVKTNRDDWTDVVGDSETRFRTYRTWA